MRSLCIQLDTYYLSLAHNIKAIQAIEFFSLMKN